jgi:hypothetical protein
LCASKWTTVLAGDDVRVGHDEVVAGGPAGALDAEPAGAAEDPHDVRSRGGDARPAQHLGRGRRDARVGTLQLRQRIEARERVEDRPRRRQRRVEPSQHLRLLHLRAQLADAWRLQHDRARDPHQPERQRRRQRRAQCAVEQADPWQPQHAAHAHPERLQDARQQAADQQRAREREQGRVRGVRAVRQQQRTDARADDRAEREAGERERANDEPAHPAEEREEGDERDDDPVDRGHGDQQSDGYPDPSAPPANSEFPVFAWIIYPRVHVEAGSRDGGARGNGPSRYSAADVERRRRLLRRLLPTVAIVAVVALAIGLIAGRDPGRAARDTVEQFATLWSRGDYRGMYALIDDRATLDTSLAEFEAAYRGAATTATTTALTTGPAGPDQDGSVTIPFTARTRVFGTVRRTLTVPVSGDGDEARVAWQPSLVFPGLRPGEELTRDTALPERGTLLARDDAVLAKGTDRSSDIPDVATQIVGRLEPIPDAEKPAMAALGYPGDALVGVSGLERVFQQQLAGTPGGRLLAGGRVLAETQPRAAPAPVKTTIDPEIERAAVAQMGSRYGGIAALEPSTGEVLALAGVAFSGLQPPGSTFKIITLVGALEAGIAKPESEYPVVSEALLSGVPIQNASGEYCGGTLVASFAHSCNSVFAPLGARLGPDRLVDVAERFGFNAPVGIPGAAVSTIPAASELGDDLDVGSTAIGQGLVQATALQMTLVAATIANGGKRPVPTLEYGARPRFVRVTSPKVAREVAHMMDEVVKDGTGTAAQIDGVVVAGKTGTAELRSTVAPEEGEELPEHLTDDIPDTDAWFVAYAPAEKPRISVGVLFTEAGAGGDVAAPAAREVLVSGLQSGTRTAG